METVKSADGTVIAYDCAGDGPALIVSVGAFCTRQTFVAPDDLTQRFTVVTYDRRGRGDSGDTEPFAPDREYEDLAAVAAATGPEPPFVFGHSSGAAIALRAAAGLPVRHRRRGTRGRAGEDHRARPHSRRHQQPGLVPALGRRASRRHARGAPGDARWIRSQRPARGHHPHPDRVLRRAPVGVGQAFL